MDKIRRKEVGRQSSHQLKKFYGLLGGRLVLRAAYNFGFKNPKTKLLDNGQPPPFCSMNLKGDHFFKYRPKRIVDGRTPEPYEVPWVRLIVKGDA
uniref:Uncharacterized protein n=1 Tax=Romanomermis culicivorax TaxID=13658 RepID=A0A915JD94_ROMCU